jgi:hypothetical protein
MFAPAFVIIGTGADGTGDSTLIEMDTDSVRIDFTPFNPGR